MECIDLRERFGRRFKVVHEESREAEFGDGARTCDPWLLMIPCQRGHIYPHGGDLLGAATNSRGSTAKKLAALACCTVAQDGDDGVNVTFDVAGFEQVAKLMKPRRRRRLSPEHREKLIAAGESSRFTGTHAKNSAPGRDGRPQGDSEPVRQRESPIAG